MTNTEQQMRAKGPTRYDLVGMHDEDFEAMAGRLIGLEFEEAFKPANTSDGGADMVLPDNEGGYEHCWQAKHYPKAIKWDECKKSFAAAQENWKPSHYTFCFPRELTAREQKTFDKHFRNKNVKEKVDYWNGEKFQTLLNASDEGQRVARTFFEDVELDRERTYAAIEAQGKLDTTEDRLDRLSNIGGFVAGQDAYFSYPGATHEAEGPGPGPTPGTVMSVEKTAGGITSRFDVVPRDAEAMERYGPELVIQPSEGEEGQRAAERLQEALSEGKAIEIGEGLDLTFTRMPPGMKDIEGERITGGKMRFGEPQRVRQPIPPWVAHLRVESDTGTAELDVRLEQTDDVPEGWDDMLVGEYGGLTLTVIMRWREGKGGEIRWNFRYTRNDTPVREQLDSLRLLAALGGTGEVIVTDNGPAKRPEARTPTPGGGVADATRALLAFLEDVRAIEEWSGVEYQLPDDLPAQEARSVAIVADIVRNQGRSITWHDMRMTVRESGLPMLRQGRVIRVEHTAGANVLGRLVDLGHTQLEVAGYKIESETPAAGQPGFVNVCVKPRDPEGEKVFERLSKEKTRAKKPPPPPPSRRRRKRGGKGGKKRRRR